MTRFTLKQLLVVVIVLTMVTAIAVPLAVRSRRDARLRACSNNLSQLWKMALHYPVYFGGPERRFQTDRGGDFWIRLTRGDARRPPIIDPSMLNAERSIFDCPVSAAWVRGATQYRGPLTDVNEYGEGDPVGADLFDAHPGGEGAAIHVLRKSGDVVSSGRPDPLWHAAATKTAP